MATTATARLAVKIKEVTTMVETMIATDPVARETTMDSPETPTATTATNKVVTAMAPLETKIRMAARAAPEM